MTDWFVALDDSLWLKPDDVGAEEAAFIWKALRLRKGHRVLDAPCGAGRIVVHLARAGCVVTGVDLRESFVRRARARFRKEEVTGTFRTMDLRALEFEDEFDAIYNWFGSFGYFSEGENFDLFRRYARALKRGGRLLIDQPNREFILRHFLATMETGGVTHYNRWDAGTERVNSIWVTHRDGKRKEDFSSIRLYTPGQMRHLFHRAGLVVEAMYGSCAGEEYRRGSRRLILVGSKEDHSQQLLQRGRHHSNKRSQSSRLPLRCRKAERPA